MSQSESIPCHQTLRRQAAPGQGLAEYALALVLVAVAAISILTLLGGSAANLYARVEASITCANGGDCVTTNAEETELITVEYAQCQGGSTFNVSIVTSYGGTTDINLGGTDLTYIPAVNRHRGTLSVACGTSFSLPFTSTHQLDTYHSSGTINFSPG